MITLLGDKPGIETVYRWNIENGPVVDGQQIDTKVRVEYVEVTVGDGYRDVTVRGKKLLKDGRPDTRTRGLDYVAFEVSLAYEKAFDIWRDAQSR